MSEAKQREAWNHTSALMALCVNLLRDPRKEPPIRPEAFNPTLIPEISRIRVFARDC